VAQQTNARITRYAMPNISQTWVIIT